MDLSALSDEKLVEMYHEGNEPAIEELFERYKNIVRKKANELFIAGGDTEDLIQEGMIGLYKAARDYKADREATFSTFAYTCISGQMLTAINKANRKKNGPLNSYVSFDEPVGDDEENQMKIGDVITTEFDHNPEKMFVDKEWTKEFEKKIEEALSKFEKNVLDLYMSGEDYISIAKTLEKSPKSIDNALQRIRQKVDKIGRM